MHIRAATVADADSLAELHVRCWQEAYAGKLPQAYLDALSVEARVVTWRRLLSGEWSAEAFVAVDDEPVAFIAVDRSGDADATPTTGAVNAIYARTRVWGTGVGRALMDRGLQALRDRGFLEATLWVLETNDRARRFYDVSGWTMDGSKHDEIGGAPVTELRYRTAFRA